MVQNKKISQICQAKEKKMWFKLNIHLFYATSSYNVTWQKYVLFFSLLWFASLRMWCLSRDKSALA